MGCYAIDDLDCLLLWYAIDDLVEGPHLINRLPIGTAIILFVLYRFRIFDFFRSFLAIPFPSVVKKPETVTVRPFSGLIGMAN
jgi:hypothetical protein